MRQHDTNRFRTSQCRALNSPECPIGAGAIAYHYECKFPAHTRQCKSASFATIKTLIFCKAYPVDTIGGYYPPILSCSIAGEQPRQTATRRTIRRVGSTRVWRDGHLAMSDNNASVTVQDAANRCTRVPGASLLRVSMCARCKGRAESRWRCGWVFGIGLVFRGFGMCWI